MRICLDTFDICPVDRQILDMADGLPGSDFEDNVAIACVTLLRLDAIVTRDPAGFRDAVLAVYSPGELLARITSEATDASSPDDQPQ